jgi:hypothetical protein
MSQVKEYREDYEDLGSGCYRVTVSARVVVGENDDFVYGYNDWQTEGSTLREALEEARRDFEYNKKRKEQGY